MPITEAFAGTATIGSTPYSLPNDSMTLTPRTEVGVFQVFIDTSALEVTDHYSLKIFETAISGGVQTQVGAGVNLSTGGIYASEAFLLMHGWDMTVVKNSGVDRSLSWSIRRVA